MASEQPWRKVLYVKQHYPDNYLDKEQFKKDLKENLHVQTYQFTEVAVSSVSVLQEVNSVCLFVLVFWLLDGRYISLVPLFELMAACASVMWTLKYCVLSRPSSVATDAVVQSILLLVFLCGTSPVLRTLTQSVSTDTIWFMTVVMFFVHLVFHNYGSKDAPLVSDSFSLNAAMFSAVCLASRLCSSLHTLVIMLLAILLFALLPHLRNDLQKQHPRMGLAIAFAITMVTGGLVLFLFSVAGVLVYVIHVAVIILVCPFWFVRLQYLKQTINGPWDVATIKLS